MATLLARVPLTATADVLLVATAQGAGPAGWRLGFLGSSWVGSVVLKANMAAPGQAQSLTSIPFITESTGATNAADTPITATGTFVVQPGYCAYDLYAVYTHTSGSAIVTVQTQDGATASGDLTAANLDGSGSQSTFGSNVPYTGAYTFPGALAITGALTGVTQPTFSTKIVSSTALATPSALAATALNAFASTVSGAVLMGYGTTGDVTLKNRAGTTVAYVGPNTTAFTVVGDLTVGASTFVVTAATGAVATSGALAITGALTGVTNFGLSGTITPSLTTGTIIDAYAGTTEVVRLTDLQNTGARLMVGIQGSAANGLISAAAAYASVISTNTATALVLGTNGTTVLTINGTTQLPTFAGALAITGALTGVTTGAFSGAVSTGALTTNGGLQTFGANDSGGAGYRQVLVPNV